MSKKIKAIYIKKLFGFLDHEIQLSDENITFIHGPNGCGKTTILKLLAAFFNHDFQVLFDEEYKAITITYHDNTKLIIKKSIKPIKLKKPSSVLNGIIKGVIKDILEDIRIKNIVEGGLPILSFSISYGDNNSDYNFYHSQLNNKENYNFFHNQLYDKKGEE